MVTTIARLGELAAQHRELVITGRSHNVAAQATTLGKRFATIADEMFVALDRLDDLIARYPLRGIKGPMGTAQDQLDLNGGTSLWRRLFDQLLARFGGHANPIAAAAIVYGILEAVEAVGLILRRRWAEYLVLLATVAFLPLELDELVRAPSALKGLAVVVNIAVAIYLIWRKELFLARDRSSAEAA